MAERPVCVDMEYDPRHNIAIHRWRDGATHIHTATSLGSKCSRTGYDNIEKLAGTIRYQEDLFALFGWFSSDIFTQLRIVCKELCDSQYWGERFWDLRQQRINQTSPTNS